MPYQTAAAPPDRTGPPPATAPGPVPGAHPAGDPARALTGVRFVVALVLLAGLAWIPALIVTTAGRLALFP